MRAKKGRAAPTRPHQVKAPTSPAPAPLRQMTAQLACAKAAVSAHEKMRRLEFGNVLRVTRTSGYRHQPIIRCGCRSRTRLSPPLAGLEQSAGERWPESQ